MNFLLQSGRSLGIIDSADDTRADMDSDRENVLSQNITGVSRASAGRNATSMASLRSSVTMCSFSIMLCEACSMVSSKGGSVAVITAVTV